MPIYEYLCQNCNGIFEKLRSVRESSEPMPCPVCDRDANRIMPTSINAFTMRDGIPRSIPDRGTYWHLGHEVSKPITGEGVAWEHPEVNKPKPEPVLAKGDQDDKDEFARLKGKFVQDLRDSGEVIAYGKNGEPAVSPPGVAEPRTPSDV